MNEVPSFFYKYWKYKNRYKDLKTWGMIITSKYYFIRKNLYGHHINIASKTNDNMNSSAYNCIDY